MEREKVTCPLCQGRATKRQADTAHEASLYMECLCQAYYVWRHDEQVCLDDKGKRATWEPKRISLLLRELRAKMGHEATPVLQFSRAPYADLPNTYPVYVPDLLAQWPDTIPERIERCFCHVIRATHTQQFGGREVEIAGSSANNPLIFAEFGIGEEDYFINAMVQYEWITSEKPHEYGPYKVCVTPKGWAHFDELNRSQGDAKDPAFVAMWFGGDERKDEMTELYDEAIEPAVRAAGYLAKRANTDEHNDPIMDRVIEYIRKAPFVVADLTENSNGVYYEAGFARGRGTDVIYCFRDEDEKKPHFDISGLNQVRYTDGADLKKRLEDRILGSISRGPYRFDGAPLRDG